jgi:hypothetical protein
LHVMHACRFRIEPSRRLVQAAEERRSCNSPLGREFLMQPMTRSCAVALLLGAITPAALVAQASPLATRAQAREAETDQRLQVQVSPSVALAPAPVRIRALVEPSAKNRQLEFVVDSVWYYRSSTIELSGARAARSYRVEFPSVPAGTHDVRVLLRDDGGEVRAMMHHRVTLLE